MSTTKKVSLGLTLYILFSQNLFPSLKIVLILAKSADPDEMPPYAAFYLGLQGLPNYRVPV